MSAEARTVRTLGYDLLSRLYLSGVTEETLPLLRQIPDLARHLSDDSDSGDDLDSGRFDFDEASVEHHRLFSLEVFPYASVYLEVDGHVGGSITGEMQSWLVEAGLELPMSESADHLGWGLAILAALTPEAGREAHLRDFLDVHLLWWLPAFVLAVSRNDRGFWGAVAELTLEVVLDHRTSMTVDEPSDSPPLQPDGPSWDPNVDFDTAFRDLPDFLMSPVRSGVYLSLSDVRALGRNERLPGGFGSRALVMRNTLNSSITYEAVEAVLCRIADLIGDARRWYDGLVCDHRMPAAFAVPWAERLKNSALVLDRLREQYQGHRGRDLEEDSRGEDR